MRYIKGYINYSKLVFITLLLTLFIPAGGAQANPKQFGDWVMACEQQAQNGQQNCVLIQEQTVQEGEGKSGRLIRVTIAPMQGEAKGNYILHTILPLGIHLPSGAVFKIDEGEQQGLSFQRCSQSGCEAVAILQGGTINEMRKGSKMLVGFKAAPQGDTLSISVSLRGSNDALNALAAVKQ